MDDMISKISSILDDPEQAAKIKQIASSMMGGDSQENIQTERERVEEQTAGTPPAQIKSTAPYDKLFSTMNCSKNVTLLNAIRPYMRSSRAEKIGSAIKAMEMMELLSKLK